MALKRNFSDKDVLLKIETARVKIDQIIMLNMSVLGVKAANHARTARTYTDRTGNLVNSTGFILLKDGQNVYENFDKTGKGTEPSTVDGTQVGRSLALSIAGEFSTYKGWVLIVVAGMEYAASVEYLHGRNVLAATELFIRAEMPKTIALISKTINSLK